jgi:hypothetical protein
MMDEGSVNAMSGPVPPGTYFAIANNLSEVLSATTARANLGFTTNTAGRVLYGDGSNSFLSDYGFAFDSANKIVTVESQITASPASLLLKSSRNALANLVAGDVAGRIAIAGRMGGAYGSLVYLETVYQGDGTTEYGDFVVSTAMAGAPTEALRVLANGTVQAKAYGAGVAFFSAAGLFQSIGTVTAAQVGYLSAVTSDIQAQLNAKQASGNYITALTGDVTATGPNSVAATIAASAVTNAKMANMATITFKGNITGGAAAPADLTATQVTANLNVFTTALKGLAPASGSATPFLRGDATWVDLPASRAKAGLKTLGSGVNSKAVVFTTTRADALYTPVCFLVNTVDTDPINVPVRGIAISSAGFTAEWSDLTDTANYSLYWAILEHYDP